MDENRSPRSEAVARSSRRWSDGCAVRTGCSAGRGFSAPARTGLSPSARTASAFPAGTQLGSFGDSQATRLGAIDLVAAAQLVAAFHRLVRLPLPAPQIFGRCGEVGTQRTCFVETVPPAGDRSNPSHPPLQLDQIPRYGGGGHSGDQLVGSSLALLHPTAHGDQIRQAALELGDQFRPAITHRLPLGTADHVAVDRRVDVRDPGTKAVVGHREWVPADVLLQRGEQPSGFRIILRRTAIQFGQSARDAIEADPDLHQRREAERLNAVTSLDQLDDLGQARLRLREEVRGGHAACRRPDESEPALLLVFDLDRRGRQDLRQLCRVDPLGGVDECLQTHEVQPPHRERVPSGSAALLGDPGGEPAGNQRVSRMRLHLDQRLRDSGHAVAQFGQFGLRGIGCHARMLDSTSREPSRNDGQR